MALEITYWGRRPDRINTPGSIISSETRTTSGSSAQSGATPDGAVVVSVVCHTAADRIEYGSNPTAAAGSAYIGVGERLWLSARPGFKLAGKTA